MQCKYNVKYQLNIHMNADILNKLKLKIIGMKKGTTNIYETNIKSRHTNIPIFVVLQHGI